METTNEKSVKLDLATMLINKKKVTQTVENEEEIVLPDECGDTLWDRVLAQEEAKNTQK